MVCLAHTGNISKYVLQELKQGKIDKNTAMNLLKKLNEKEDVAIIGMSCLTGSIDNCEDYWDLFNQQKTNIKRCDKKRIDLIKPNLPQGIAEDVNEFSKGAYIKDIDLFDHEFFSYSKKEADVTYPGIRKILEVTYRALEDAGYLGERLKGNSTGVFIGNHFTKDAIFSYLRICLENQNYQFPFDSMLNNWSSGLATRISNFFDLKGPSYVIDASCSASTIAILNACNAIKQNTCTTAVAGGILMDIAPIQQFGNAGWVFMHEDNIITRLFDDDPGGAYMGEGAGIFVLKSLSKALEDGDNIHGVIGSISLNNNGSNGSYTQSSSDDIKKVVIEAIKEAKIDVTDIGFLTGEGFPNKLEESLELSGIIDGFNHFTNKKQFCGLGGITPNVGFMQSSIGILNSILCVLALKKRILPPLYHYITPSDHINFCKSPFYVNDISKEWICSEGKTRCAAVHSYGYGGINMLTILKEAPEPKAYKKIERKELFILTAKSKYSFTEGIKAYIEFLRNQVESNNLTEICYSSCTRRIIFNEYRLAIVANDVEDLLEKLKMFQGSIQCNEVFYGEQLMDQKEKKRKIRYESVVNKDKNIIGEEFCAGKEFEFINLYMDEQIGYSNLPRYVFDKKSFWCHRQNFSPEMKA